MGKSNRLTWALVCFLGFTVGCKSPQQSKPSVPPFLVDKEVFRPDRVWYTGATVVDAPFATSAIAYIGDSEPLEKVRWSIQEEFLIGYRAYSLFWGDEALAPEVSTHADPVLSFRILEHVDLFQGQVVSAPRTSWADKRYMRVDWSKNLVPRYSDAKNYAPVAYAVTDPDDPDAPQVTDSYVEITQRFGVIEPEAPDPYSSTPGTPVCGGDGDFMLCEPGEFKVKRSWFPVPENDFEPKPTTTQEWSRFAMFQKAFLYVDGRYGATEAGKRFFVDAYNLWKRSKGEDGRPLPYRDREVRPIVWYLNEAFPANLVPYAAQAVADWNEAFRDAVNGLRYWECVDAGGSDSSCQAARRADLQVVKLCPHNPVAEGDDPDCGEPGLHVRLGDLRYNSIQWLTATVESNAAGVGWFNVDHETGEIVSSTVYLNALPQFTYAYQAATALQLMNGDAAQDDPYFAGADIAAWVNSRFATSPFGPYPLSTVRAAIESLEKPAPWPGLSRPVPSPLGPQERAARLGAMNTSWMSTPGLPPLDTGSYQALQASLSARLNALVERGALGEDPAVTRSRENRVLGTPFEDALIDREALARAFLETSAGVTPEQLRALASPLRPHRPASQSSGSVQWDPVRSGVFDLVYLNLSKAYKGWTRERIVDDLISRSMRGFVAHELGHCFGMRHNFAASFDPLNFPSQYWAIRNDGFAGPRWKDPMTPTEVGKGLLEHSYSSVMDYFGSGIERGHGLGHYDRAAIKFVYGNLVEVLDDPLAKANANLANQVQLWHNSFLANGRFVDAAGNVRGLHYTEYPKLFGDLERRVDVPKSKLIDAFGLGVPLALPDGRPAVPYRACSDFESQVYATCQANDRGADPYEVGLDRIQRYYAYYSENYFRRGRLWLGVPEPQGYMGLFQSLTQTFVINSMAVSDKAQLAGDDGFAATTFALAEGFDFLSDVLTLPEPGGYTLSTTTTGKPLYSFAGYGAGAFNVRLGEGRFFQTQTDPPATGRGFRERVRAFGSSLDKLEALNALTQAQVAVPNAESLPDVRPFTASYFRVYPNALGSLFGAILSEDWDETGPVANPASGALLRRRWTDSSASWPPATGTPLAPEIPHTVRAYLRTVALARLDRGPENTFADSARVVVLGEGNDFSTALPTVTFSDPGSGKSYRALSKVVGGQETGVGARVLVHAQALLGASLDVAATPEARAAAADALRSFVQEVDHLHRMSRLFDQP